MMYFLLTKSKHYLGILILFLLPIMALADNESILPDFGDSAGALISPEYDRRLGQLFLKHIRQFASIVTDPEVSAYIQSLGYQLRSHSDNPEQTLHFLMLDDPRINAFAGPGGIIGINSGVIIHSNDESELAAVMAHEISHVTQRHLQRTFEETRKFSLAKAAALIGAIIVSTQSPDAGLAAITGIVGLSAQNQISFTQSNEKEADRIGIQLLARAGFDPQGMSAFFTKLQKLSRYAQSGVPEFLRTHPLTTSRIADSQARIANYPLTRYSDSKSYALIKYKLIVDSAKTAQDAIIALRAKLNETTISAREKLAIHYGLAYAYIKNSAFDLAGQHLKYLLDDAPDNVAYLLLSAKLATAQSNYTDALAIYNQTYQLYPDYRPVVIAYSRALLDIKQGKKARDLLKNYERHHSHDLATYSLLGQAEAILGNEIETAMIQTEYYYLAGETKLAIDKLKFIKQQYTLNYYQEQRRVARMTALEYELELEEKIKL